MRKKIERDIEFERYREGEEERARKRESEKYGEREMKKVRVRVRNVREMDRRWNLRKK